MEVKRCARCGQFFETVNEVCHNCIAKDNQEISQFKTYLQENEDETSLNNVAFKTGISQTNLTRFLSYDGFEDYGKNFK